ncbi:MAG: anti-sigma factor [bacterium]
MQCQDMEKFIHVYLDREFAEEDRADYERHLAGCERCRGLARFEQRFKQQLKTSLARPRLRLDERESVRRRVMQTLADAPPLPADRRAWRWALRLAPAAAAAGLLVAIVLQQHSGRPSVVSRAILIDGMDRPPEVKTRDPSKVRAWYQEKIGLAAPPPQFSDGRTALVGGRIDQVNAKQAAHLIYDRGDRKISVMMFRGNVPYQGMVLRRIGSKNVYFSHGGSRNVAAFHHHGVGYMITGVLPRQDLDGLVRDVLYQGARFPEPPAVKTIPVSAPGGN